MSYAPFGGDGIVIRVEADIRRGIPGVDISGLAAGAVQEARERVRAAFRNSRLEFPQDRVLINLAPAGVRKDGTALDLPIALAVMAASGKIRRAGEDRDLDGPVMVLGELELSGRLRPVRGVLAAVDAGLRRGIRRFIVPAENRREAAILMSGNVSGLVAAQALNEAVEALERLAGGGVFALERAGEDAEDAEPDLSAPAREDAAWTGDAPPLSGWEEVRGQERYKRAMEIAAAGGHNMLVFGPPGAGKTMLARRMPAIMAPLEPEEAVEVTRLHSLAGALPGNGAGLSGSSGSGLIIRPPFRSPHHSASPEGILGGGKYVRPGEISLANFGVLFMDEAPEFKISVLQALREPLEDRVLTISRAEGPVRLPADFQLVLAANPCPCGRFGRRGSAGDGGACFCSAEEIRRYWRRFSGALLDRVEIRVAVLPPETETLGRPGGETGAQAAERVRRAVEIQRERFRNLGVRRNARMTPFLVERFCPLTGEARRLLDAALDRLGFSARAYHGCLRTARTIADMEGAETINSDHLLEAVEHRRQGEDPGDILALGE